MKALRATPQTPLFPKIIKKVALKGLFDLDVLAVELRRPRQVVAWTTQQAPYCLWDGWCCIPQTIEF